MKMIRTTYCFDGKDYSDFEKINFSFLVPKNSIQNFIDFLKETHKYKLNYEILHKENSGISEIKISVFAYNFYKICKALNVNDDSQVLNFWSIPHSRFFGKKRTSTSFYGYSCYDPVKRTSILKNGSPFVIKGTQQVFNGKLWRRLF